MSGRFNIGDKEALIKFARECRAGDWTTEMFQKVTKLRPEPEIPADFPAFPVEMEQVLSEILAEMHALKNRMRAQGATIAMLGAALYATCRELGWIEVEEIERDGSKAGDGEEGEEWKRGGD